LKSKISSLNDLALGLFTICELTDSIKQLSASCVFEENVLGVSLCSLSEELKDVRMRENLLYADLLLDGRGRVRVLFEIDHLHGHRLARLPIDEQLHPARGFARLTSKIKIDSGFAALLTRHTLPRPVSERDSNFPQTLWHSAMPFALVGGSSSLVSTTKKKLPLADPLALQDLSAVLTCCVVHSHQNLSRILISQLQPKNAQPTARKICKKRIKKNY
jgi:hypothetical protein